MERLGHTARHCSIGRLVLLAALAAAPGTARGAEAPDAGVAGTWHGALSVSGVGLRLVFHVEESSGGLTGSIDSPDQGAAGIPLSEVEAEAGRVRFASAAIAGEFVGRAVGDGTVLEGVWRQSGMELPLRLHLGDRDAEPPQRPQEPRGDPPYRSEEVRFASLDEDVALAGTLTLPAGAGPFPAVLLISGSGAQDRDSSLLGHRLFAVLADHLTRLGVAVLRVDDRGVGASTGEFAAATAEEFAADAHAGFGWLRARPEIEPAAVGLVGHSEGALVAPMVAARDPAVAFLVLLAPPGVPGSEIFSRQGEAILRASGTDEETVRRERAIREELVAAVLGTEDPAAAERAVRAALDRHVAALTESDPGLFAQTLDAQAARIASPWFRLFLRHDPTPVLARVRCPVLAVWGGNDLQVPPDQSLPPLQAALAGTGGRRLTARVLPGLNHLLQTSATGLPVEYGRIEETLAPEALELVAGWIRGIWATVPADG